MTTSWLTRNLPNALTLANGFAGLAAVLWCFAALQHEALATGLRAAFLLIAAGVLFDTIDGPIARLLKVNNPMGAQLDSLCDGVTFGFATALVLGASFWQQSPLLAFVLACWWLAAALLRLARFNLGTDTSTAHFYFSGMCSPVAALFMVSVLDATVATPWFPGLPLAMAVLLPALMLSSLTFADLPKHYLGKRRSKLELLVTAVLMWLLSPSIGISLFLTWFLLETVISNLRKRTAR